MAEEEDLAETLKVEQEKNEALSHALRSFGVDPEAVIRGVPPSSIALGEEKDGADDGDLRQSITADGVAWFDRDLAEKYDHLISAVKRSGLNILSGVEVRYTDVSYTITKPLNSAGAETFGTKAFALASLLWCRPCVERSRSGGGVASKAVLTNCTGVLAPGEITLVIGPPGSGKTSLLRVLAGQLKAKGRGISLQGSVTYNGCAPNDGFSLPKVAAYIDERDEHIPQLTVEETFDFAYKNMRGGRHQLKTDGKAEAVSTPELDKLLAFMDENNATVRWATMLLGLKAAKNTIIGDELTRGVSGGERRRVTSGELLVGGASVLLMDSISTGLDSSTTFDIIEALRLTARAFRLTIVVALLQPPPEVFQLFDKVIAMAGGYIIYHGPTTLAIPYFEGLGFKKPQRKDAADFIVELPTSQGAAYKVAAEEAAESGRALVAPSTPADFAERWAESAEFAEMKRQMATEPFRRQWSDVEKRRYAGTLWFHTKLSMMKYWRLNIRDRVYTRTRIAMSVGIGIIVGATFFNLDPSNTPSKFGVLYFGSLFLAMSGLSAIPIAFATRAVLYKQTAAGFYPPIADTLAQAIAAVPLQVLEAVIFAPLVWFMSGMYSGSAGPFLWYLLVIVCMNCNMAQLNRMLAAALPSYTAATGIAAVLIMVMILFSGYIIPYKIIPKFWYFAYWPNPVAWAFRASVILEYTSPAYTTEEGDAVLSAYGITSDFFWVYSAVAVLAGQWLLYCAFTALLLRFVRYDPSADKPIEPEKAASPTLEGSSRPKIVPGESETHAVAPASASAVTAAAQAASTGDAGAGAGSSAAALHFEPASMVFNDLRYSVPHPSGEGELDLLKGISGFCLPGTSTALMGSSGAGKTTLLDVLAGRKTGGTIKGDVLINGRPKVQKTFTRIAAYCEQNDIHSPVVTVREAVEFSARMRLDADDVSDAARASHVNQVLESLGLMPIQNRLIGGKEGGGLAIEEKKRVTIAVELAANPSILFLDEPTSGLDARAAQMVMTTVSRVAATGRTIICTIHQPSTALFEMFDSLLLLKKGGETVYFGQLGQGSSTLIEYLEAIPGTPTCPAEANPATWMLECIGAGTSGKVDSSAYALAYRASARSEETQAEVNRLAKDVGAELHFKNVYAAPFSTQMKACNVRAMLQYYRSPSYSFSKQVLSAIVAVIFASSFVGKEYNDQASLTGRLGIFYMSLSFMGALYMGTVMQFVSAERAVFYREQASNMYKPAAYASGYLFGEIPFNVLAAFIFSGVFYYMANFTRDPVKFFEYLLCFGLYTTFQSYFGQLLVNATPSLGVAQTISTICSSLFNIFAGFMINKNAISPVFLWLYYLDPQAYALQNIVTSQFHDDNTLITTASGTFTASQFIDIFFEGTFSYSRFASNIVVLIAFIAAVRVMNVLSLQYLRFVSR